MQYGGVPSHEHVPRDTPAYIDVGERTEVGFLDEPRFVETSAPPGLEKGPCPLVNSWDLVAPHPSLSSVWPEQVDAPVWALGAPWWIGTDLPWTFCPLLNGQRPKTMEYSAAIGVPEFKRRDGRKTPLVLARGLSELEDHDPDCVIYARGIHRLGFDSESILRGHYERYGRVERIFFSNAHETPHGLKHSRGRVRVRPSSIALILMASPEEAATALALGDVQVIHGVPIVVRKFVHRDERASIISPTSSFSDDAISESTSMSTENDANHAPSSSSSDTSAEVESEGLDILRI